MAQIGSHRMGGGEGMKRRGEDVRCRQRARGVEGMGQTVEARCNGGARAWASCARIPFTARRELQLYEGVSGGWRRRWRFEKDASFLSRKQGYGLTLGRASAALPGVSDAIAQASSWSQYLTSSSTR